MHVADGGDLAEIVVGRYRLSWEGQMGLYTLFVETSGDDGVPSQREETELREGDEIVWSRDRVLLFRTLVDVERWKYRRLRRTTLASIGVAMGDAMSNAKYDLPLPLGSRAPDVIGVMGERYGPFIPSFFVWDWKQQEAFLQLTTRRRFRATGRPV